MNDRTNIRFFEWTFFKGVSLEKISTKRSFSFLIYEEWIGEDPKKEKIKKKKGKEEIANFLEIENQVYQCCFRTSKVHRKSEREAEKSEK